jgi:NAD(P)-dependent dehydrogenase (short-subunit alcohol dehydrogenase family)
MNQLEGKVAVITGGAAGFGYCNAELFAREGSNAMIAARPKEKGIAAVEQLKRYTGIDVRFFQYDVSKEPPESSTDYIIEK